MPKTFICPKCHTIILRNNYGDHVLQCFPEIRYDCCVSNCRESFTTDQELSQHAKRVHWPTNSTEKDVPHKSAGMGTGVVETKKNDDSRFSVPVSTSGTIVCGYCQFETLRKDFDEHILQCLPKDLNWGTNVVHRSIRHGIQLSILLCTKLPPELNFLEYLENETVNFLIGRLAIIKAEYLSIKEAVESKFLSKSLTAQASTSTISNRISAITTSKLIICPHCRSKISIANFATHIFYSCPEKHILPCLIDGCRQLFRSRDYLHKHSKLVHPTEPFSEEIHCFLDQEVENSNHSEETETRSLEIEREK